MWTDLFITDEQLRGNIYRKTNLCIRRDLEFLFMSPAFFFFLQTLNKAELETPYWLVHMLFTFRMHKQVIKQQQLN